eukprot:g50643.t1
MGRTAPSTVTATKGLGQIIYRKAKNLMGEQRRRGCGATTVTVTFYGGSRIKSQASLGFVKLYKKTRTKSTHNYNKHQPKVASARIQTMEKSRAIAR